MPFPFMWYVSHMKIKTLRKMLWLVVALSSKRKSREMLFLGQCHTNIAAKDQRGRCMSPTIKVHSTWSLPFQSWPSLSRVDGFFLLLVGNLWHLHRLVYSTSLAHLIYKRNFAKNMPLSLHWWGCPGQQASLRYPSFQRWHLSELNPTPSALPITLNHIQVGERKLQMQPYNTQEEMMKKRERGSIVTCNVGWGSVVINWNKKVPYWKNIFSEDGHKM